MTLLAERPTNLNNKSVMRPNIYRPCLGRFDINTQWQIEGILTKKPDEPGSGWRFERSVWRAPLNARPFVVLRCLSVLILRGSVGYLSALPHLLLGHESETTILQHSAPPFFDKACCGLEPNSSAKVEETSTPMFGKRMTVARLIVNH
ncbi:hypothetical protein CEXT_246971, partial [Caerostris extrusa]